MTTTNEDMRARTDGTLTHKTILSGDLSDDDKAAEDAESVKAYPRLEVIRRQNPSSPDGSIKTLFDTALTKWNDNHDDNSIRVVSIDPKDGATTSDDSAGVILDGLTITGGYGTGATGASGVRTAGAGLRVQNNAKATIRECVFEYNRATNIAPDTETDVALSQGHGAAAFMPRKAHADFFNCIFRGNSAEGRGGALFHDHGTGSIEDCTFENNYANDRGGAAFYLPGSGSSMRGCTFTDNGSDEKGGALYVSNKHVSHCTFTGNSSGYTGGAVFALVGANLVNCTFKNNSAVDENADALLGEDVDVGDLQAQLAQDLDTTVTTGLGGAVYFADGGFLTNCLFYGNSANYSAGAVYAASSIASVIRNCTFYKNTAGAYGGALVVDFRGAAVFNSIFWKNQAGDDIDASDGDGDQIHHVASRGDLLVRNCLVEGGESSLSRESISGGYYVFNLSSADPRFSDLREGSEDFSLQSNSPAINAGDNTYVAGGDGTWNPADADKDGILDDNDVAADLAGNERLAGDNVDLGAYEYAATPTASTLANALPSKALSVYRRLSNIPYEDDFKLHTHAGYALTDHTHADTGSSRFGTAQQQQQQHSHQKSVVIKPNPAQDVVELSAKQAFTYTILNTAGMQVGTGSVQVGENSINVKALPRGMYLVVFQGEGYSETHRLVVK